ncbi:mannose-1-phosphate guanylyltransferase [Schaedlerella arabinosiphila]|uniref:mannose-1-phosphate guanylyltransferase n=1 Tax=Schaedlerella arabinosiphila TaxID=2044587 RepID=A0A426DLU0_9FIRM|nr:sugar phosphate nucleotidyltransferase [Schaedlerella arabinosiphila]RRK33729.1 mannose-1-phosphate guanylyltransferase [Schaedlerella arabinosiphila]
MNTYGVILAGGGGTRFWPLSRQKTPKQLLNLSGKELMVNEAVERMSTVIGKSNIFIVTAESQASSMIRATQGKVFPRNILAEPAARNTTACIGYSAMEIVRKYGDGVMIITPADHYIEDVPALTEILKAAILTAENYDKLVTIGIKPTFPSIGFGYIKYETSAESDVKPVVEFKEKPDEETAKRYVGSGEYVWNSGIFIWKASLVLNKLKEYVPDIYEDFKTIGDSMNTPNEQEVLHKVYPNIRKISIDYAVMEPSAAKGDVLVIIPSDCGWNDVGSWDMMETLHAPDEDGNIIFGDGVAVDTKDTVIYSSSRTVTAVDVENLIIVETPDAIMVCRKDKAQGVKKIVDALNDAGRKELL